MQLSPELVDFLEQRCILAHDSRRGALLVPGLLGHLLLQLHHVPLQLAVVPVVLVLLALYHLLVRLLGQLVLDLPHGVHQLPVLDVPIHKRLHSRSFDTRPAPDRRKEPGPSLQLLVLVLLRQYQPAHLVYRDTHLVELGLDRLTVRLAVLDLLVQRQVLVVNVLLVALKLRQVVPVPLQF